MAVNEGYWAIHNAFHNRDNYEEVFSAALNKMLNQVNLGPITSCLTFGTGDGRYEMEFIEKFAPNITKLLAVEPDQQSIERLRARLSKVLAGIDSRIVKTDMQSWEGPNQRSDLALLFQVLYFLTPTERKTFFKNLHDRWLSTDGLAVVFSASRTKCPGNSHEIVRRLGTPLLAWEDLEADMTEAGFIKRYEYEMKMMRNYSNPDEYLCQFYQDLVDRPITLEELRDTINELFTDRQAEAYYCLAVFKA